MAAIGSKTTTTNRCLTEKFDPNWMLAIIGIGAYVALFLASAETPITDQSHVADMPDIRSPNRNLDRTVVIGNSGGGKSTLARRLAARHDLPYIEVDRLLWRPGWELVPEAEYNAEHNDIINQERWLLDGLGRKESIAARLTRATTIILVDMPLWMHFWLAAERQIAWIKGDLAHTPGEIGEMPPTEALFRTIWEIDQDWMPLLRDLTSQCEDIGASIERITSVDQLTRFQQAMAES